MSPSVTNICNSAAHPASSTPPQPATIEERTLNYKAEQLNFTYIYLQILHQLTYFPSKSSLDNVLGHKMKDNVFKNLLNTKLTIVDLTSLNRGCTFIIF